MKGKKDPLYRKVNSHVTHLTMHDFHGGSDFRHDRNTKVLKNFEGNKLPMKNKKQWGLDYTPLYRFLHSKIGQNWDVIHSEALSRLDKEEPIWHIVAKHEGDKRGVVRTGTAFHNGLYVDENNILQMVDPLETNEKQWPGCHCCTHTFNGKLFVNKYDHNKNNLY